MRAVLRLLLGSFLAASGLLPLALAVSFPHVWPLGNTTCAYDVASGDDAITPTLDACGALGESDHPGQSYRPLKVDGQLTPYIDLQVKAPPDGDFAFTLNLRPDQLSGVILDYRSNSSCWECVTKLTAQLDPSGSLVVHLAGVNANGAVVGPDVLNESVALSAGTWSFLTLGADVSSDKLEIQRYEVSTGSRVSDLAPFSEVVKLAKRLGLPGRLRLGAKLEGSSGYVGELTCAGLVQQKKDPTLAEAALRCSDHTTWSSTPPAPVFRKPYFYVFPLYSLSAGYDVNHNVSRVLMTSQRSLRPSSVVTPLGHGSLTMDGSVLSTVDISLDFDILQENFAFGLYVNFSATSFGVLLHATASLTSGIRDLMVTFNSTHVTATVKDGATQCGEVTASRMLKGWNTLSVGRHGNKLNLDLGQSRTSSTDSCTANMAAASSGEAGVVRVGGSHGDGDEGFHGNVACAVVFDVTLVSAASASTDVITACNLPHLLPPEADAPAALLRGARSTLVALDLQPNSTFPPMASFEARSVNACAKSCLEKTFCRSFAVATVSSSKDSKSNGKNSSRVCRLYDQLIKTQLVPSKGVKYYSQGYPRSVLTV